MTSSLIDKLEQAIRGSGEEWLIDSFAPPSEAMNRIRKAISELDSLAKQRLGKNSPDLSENAIVEEYTRNPTKIRAFFQALGSTHNPEMLLMVFRIIRGMEIDNVQISYEKKKAFNMQVELLSPYGEPSESYNSQNINDFALLRHFGILTIDEKPVLDGFYSLRLGKSS